MHLAYSDEATVFLNGQPLYSDNNTLSFRQSNFLGLMDYESDAVYLPLKKGDNKLMFSVAEYFGGRVFLCKLTGDQ